MDDRIKPYADLRGAKIDPLTVARLSILPSEGELIGWKKCRDEVIVRLRVPALAKRSNSTERKCRAEYVEVIEIFGGEHGVSTHDGTTQYRKGEIVRCDKWCDDRWATCAGGIHFYITREEAEAHV